MKLERWNESTMGSMDLESIMRRHQPIGRFRFSECKGRETETFAGAMRRGFCYVISGGCSYTFGDQSIEIPEGFFAELPEGKYRFRTDSPSTFHEVMVWPLPPALWGSGSESAG